MRVRAASSESAARLLSWSAAMTSMPTNERCSAERSSAGVKLAEIQAASTCGMLSARSASR